MMIKPDKQWKKSHWYTTSDIFMQYKPEPCTHFHYFLSHKSSGTIPLQNITVHKLKQACFQWVGRWLFIYCLLEFGHIMDFWTDILLERNEREREKERNIYKCSCVIFYSVHSDFPKMSSQCLAFICDIYHLTVFSSPK